MKNTMWWILKNGTRFDSVGKAEAFVRDKVCQYLADLRYITLVSMTYLVVTTQKFQTWPLSSTKCYLKLFRRLLSATHES